LKRELGARLRGHDVCGEVKRQQLASFLGEQFAGLVDAGEGQGMTQRGRGSVAVLGLRSA